ncbi:hypothetical protein, partial [Streptomyces luridiscabiei]|uniref:hypothetical protein n=1 Tax=Streptomyces luridiscabiei TaxID=164114 RepID=UPI001F414F8B
MASPAAVAAYVTAAPCTSPPMTYTDDRQEHGQEDVAGGTGHRDVDPSPEGPGRGPVTGRRHNVLLTRFLTPAGHNPAGKPPRRWASLVEAGLAHR